MLKGQGHTDEFAFVLLAGIILLLVFMIAFTSPTEPLPTIEPSTISLQVQSGSTGNFNLKISGKSITNVSLSASGEISDWLSFSTAAIDSITDSNTVNVRVTVPFGASIGTHTGTVSITSTGGEKSVPVTINVVSVTTLSSLTIPLQDFVITFTPTQRTLDSKQNVEVSKGAFSEQSVTLFGTIQDDLNSVTGGSVDLLVKDTNSLGDLIVTVNGNEIFKDKVSQGLTSIPIDKNLISKTLSVRIYATSPGYQFWTSTSYEMMSVKLTVDLQSVSVASFPFTLSSSEVNNFDHLLFSARVRDYSQPLQPLQISINGQLVYWELPTVPFISKTFSNDVLGNDLFLTTNNTISFNLETDSFYDLANVLLIVYYKSF